MSGIALAAAAASALVSAALPVPAAAAAELSGLELTIFVADSFAALQNAGRVFNVTFPGHGT